MKKLSIITASLFLVVGLAAPVNAQAQTGVKVGPRVGIPVGDLSDFTSVFLGADLRVINEELPVVPSASFDYYLTDVENFSVIAVDLNALYEFGVDNQEFVPYSGGGLAVTRSSDDTEIGLNIVGGARFPLGGVEPFAQLNATLGGNVQRLGLTGGLLFSL